MSLGEAAFQLGLLLLKLRDLGVDLSNPKSGGSVDEDGGDGQGGGTERLGGGLEVHDFSFGWGLITSHVFFAKRKTRVGSPLDYYLGYSLLSLRISRRSMYSKYPMPTTISAAFRATN